MSNVYPRLAFVCPFGEREATESEARGYCGFAVVEFDEDSVVPVVFYDTVRLQQDLQEHVAMNRPFIADPGMIVVDRVTIDNMRSAIDHLIEEGYFQYFHKMPRAAS